MNIKSTMKKKHLFLLAGLISIWAIFFCWRYLVSGQATRLPAETRRLTSSDFVTIEADNTKFFMGSPHDEEGRAFNEEGKDGKPVEVVISKSFQIMITEVTQNHWYEVMDDNPSFFRNSINCSMSGYRYIKNISKITIFGKGIENSNKEVEICERLPVEQVSWHDVQTFIQKLNDKHGRKGCDGTPKSKPGCFRLPTEAEWEFAIRGGTTSAYSFDNEEDLKYHGCFNKGIRDGERNILYRATCPVGFLTPNPNRLRDMHGNVWEWVQDNYTRFLPGGTDPLHTDSSNRHTIRGGSWDSNAWDLRSASRRGKAFDYKSKSIGFRLVKTL